MAAPAARPGEGLVAAASSSCSAQWCLHPSLVYMIKTFIHMRKKHVMIF
jgi:hypothetical protein